MQKKVKAFAPATVANISCGFDILGLSIDRPGDEVVAEFKKSPGVEIKAIIGDDGKLPKDAMQNTAGLVVQKLLDHLKSDAGIALTLHKQMPIGSGLGSSAASAAAALVAANTLLGEPLTKEQLQPFGLEGEKLAAGTAHADNVVPSLLGGIVLVRSYDPLDIIPLPCPEKLWIVVMHPHIEIKTSDARRVLRNQVALSNAISQMGNVAGFITGLFRNDIDLIGRSLQDHLIEPIRSVIIPGFHETQHAALAAGALGCSISGSGPSMFAMASSKKSAEKVGEKMQEAMMRIGLESDLYISQINQEGAKVVYQQ